MFFHALFSQNAAINSEIFNLGPSYGFELTTTVFLKEKIDPKYHHVVCLSQEDPQYQQLIQELKSEYPDIFFVVLVNQKEKISFADLQKDYLIFMIEDDTHEIFYHQFWMWLFKLLSAYFKITSYGAIQIGEGYFYPLKSCFERDGQEFYLTEKQNEILKMLVQQRGQIVSRISLLENIWNTDKISTDRVIDTNIVAIRKVIGGNTYHKYLQTISGQGYRLNYQ